MRFTLIDRITHLQEGECITAVKALSLAEEYLQDHFPRFPVMPGVLMLEAMYQTAAWLVLKSEDFAHSVVQLAQARNAKFQDFVRPGQLLVVRAEMISQEENHTTLKTQATVDQRNAASARLVVSRYNLADQRPSYAAADEAARRELRRMFECLYQG